MSRLVPGKRACRQLADHPACIAQVSGQTKQDRNGTSGQLKKQHLAVVLEGKVINPG